MQESAKNVEDEASIFCDGKKRFLRLSEIMFEDQSPSLSLHLWSSVQQSTIEH